MPLGRGANKHADLFDDRVCTGPGARAAARTGPAELYADVEERQSSLSGFAVAIALGNGWAGDGSAQGNERQPSARACGSYAFSRSDFAENRGLQSRIGCGLPGGL